MKGDKLVKFICAKCGNTWIGYTDGYTYTQKIKNGDTVKTLCIECVLKLQEKNQIDFDEAKRLMKDAIDEAETRGDILRIWIEKIYQKGKDDCNTCSQTVPIPTDDGKLCCDACGCEIQKGQETCECCKRKIDWEK